MQIGTLRADKTPRPRIYKGQGPIAINSPSSVVEVLEVPEEAGLLPCVAGRVFVQDAGHACWTRMRQQALHGGLWRRTTTRALGTCGSGKRSRWLLVSAGRPRTFHVFLDIFGGHCIVITGGDDGGRYLRRGGSVTDALTPRYLRVRRRRHYTVQSAAVSARVPRYRITQWPDHRRRPVSATGRRLKIYHRCSGTVSWENDFFFFVSGFT